MFEQVKANLLQRAPLNEAQLDLFCRALKVRQVRKRQSVLLEGMIMSFVIYVNKGLLRLFTTDEQGNEQTFDFADEHTWTADLYSFNHRLPSGFNIDALEDSEIFTLKSEDALALHKAIPQLETFSRNHAEEKYIEALARLQKINHSNFSAEQRYLSFLDVYPMLANRIPLMHLASYLGIAPETLSRIRKDLSKQN